MEKLQQALEKARMERARSATSAQDPGAVLPASHEAAHDELWDAIRRFDPDPDVLRRNRVVSFGSGAESNMFDILRTKIVLLMRKNGWRRLAITSPTPACGKSTIACNLALGLSRQKELRTIAMELDLRKPSMARILGLRPDRDITDLIGGDVSFADQAVRIRDNVAVSVARQASPDPTQHLLGQAMQDRLAEIEDLYAPDLMFFDVPPALVSDDTPALLGKMDCALIMACAEKTTIGQIDTCEREVAEHTNVLGVVLNEARFIDTDSGYGYYYGSRGGS